MAGPVLEEGEMKKARYLAEKMREIANGEMFILTTRTVVNYNIENIPNKLQGDDL